MFGRKKKQEGWKEDIWGVGKGKVVPDMKSYNGYPLEYERTATVYGAGGYPQGKIRVGRDSDGKLCVEGGKYVSAQNVNGEIIYFYKTKKAIIGIKK